MGSLSRSRVIDVSEGTAWKMIRGEGIAEVSRFPWLTIRHSLFNLSDFDDAIQTQNPALWAGFIVFTACSCVYWTTETFEA